VIEKTRIALPMSVWIIGRPNAGKTTAANRLCTLLTSEGYRAVVIDGGALSRGTIGYTKPDRLKMFKKYINYSLDIQAEAPDVIPIVATVGGYKSFRDLIRETALNPKIIHLACPFNVAVSRDDTYWKALDGKEKNFFGVDVPYESPQRPDLKIRTDKLNEFHVVRNIRRSLDAIC